jgi:nitrogen-specific signal transduction histidine kinase/uncharacterized membrane protein affecting hemolysin expression
MFTINVFIMSHQKVTLKEEMQKNHSIIIRNLAKEAIEPLLLKDPLKLDEIVKRTSTVPGCIYAAIYDIDKKIVAHSNRRELGQKMSSEIDHSTDLVMHSGKDYVRNVTNDIKEILVPIKTGNEILGMIIVGFSKKDMEYVIDENLNRLKKNVLLISGIVMLIGIWGSFGLAKILTTPMKKLKEKMELVQQGNFDVEVPNEYVVNCWDVLNCDIKECPAYGERRCWSIPNTLCNGAVQKSSFEKMCACKNCIVYKQSCGDEIGELIEGFNQMITTLKDSINRLEETSKEKMRLEKLSLLGEMSMTVAHEIKNPLNSIRGAVCYLKDNFRGEVLNEFLTIIEDETKRLNDIVTSFLRFSKPVPLNLRLSNINTLIKETVDLIRQEATENNVEVIISLREDIPSFNFDPQQLKQAILNLLVNALDATREGDIIRIITEKVDSKVKIIISDTGIGIDEKLIADIFKPFFTTKTRGSGIGLACVERIIKDHRGEISVKSIKGSGTEFIIILPILH